MNKWSPEQEDIAYEARMAHQPPGKGQEQTNQGLRLYREGKYVRAAQRLWHACYLLRDYGGAAQLADIYLRNLDNGKHSKEDAAHWYFIAAEQGGDSDVYSYLMSLDKEIFTRADRIQFLVSVWEKK